MNEKSEKNRHTHLPLIIRFTLTVTNRSYIGEAIIGDFEEYYRELVADIGRLRSLLWCCRQILRSAPQLIRSCLTWRYAMWRNYLKTGLRSLNRRKVFSSINIIGLAVGLACCILIFLWVRHELSYDRYHEHRDRVYRVCYGDREGDSVEYIALSPFGLFPYLKSDVPEVEACTRLHYVRGLVTVNGDKHFSSGQMYYVDPDFFKVFTHRFLRGNPETALSESGSIVITERSAMRWFGTTDAVGKIIQLSDEGDLLVTGVIESVPRNSHFRFEALLSNHRIQKNMQDLYSSWGWIRGWLYARLDEGASVDFVRDKIHRITELHYGEEGRRQGEEILFALQRITDIHLRSHLIGEHETNGNLSMVILFSLIAVFILLIACVNFMNLSTARSAHRSLEVGLRKVMGAHRKHIIHQFLGETILTVSLAVCVALLLVGLALPAFSRFARRDLGFEFMTQWSFWLWMVILMCMTGLTAGSYPAFYLSRFRPIVTLKRMMTKGLKGTALRSGLVVFQFAVSIMLIIGTIVILHQISFMKNKDLGFRGDRVLVVWLPGQSIQRQAPAFKEALLRNPAIHRACISYGLPGDVFTTRSIMMEGRPEGESKEMGLIFSDHDFSETYDLEIVKGRDFSESFESDKEGAYLVNETAADVFGWGLDAVGKQIGFEQDDMGTIVGIVRDFHYETLREPIRPLVIRFSNRRIYNISILFDTQNVPELIEYVGSVWKTFEPNRELNYVFADDNFVSAYGVEDRLGRMITVFAAISVAVACLGLFGLASYAAEQQAKEIGIRKVLGATGANIVLLLTRSFIKWVLISNLIAWPFAYLAMRLWLRSYAFQAPLAAWIFITSGGIALGIAVLTVAQQAIRAAGMNPVDSLKYE